MNLFIGNKKRFDKQPSVKAFFIKSALPTVVLDRDNNNCANNYMHIGIHIFF